VADPDITARVALDSDPDDPSPVWTDLTSRLHYGEGGSEVTVTIGRQDEQDQIKPTEMQWAMRNGDNALTPNNPGSVYAGKWEQGKRCDITETVDGDTFTLGTGFLSIPDMPIVDPRSQQAVAVTAVDWMGRAEAAPPFEGTLAEHVRSTGGPMTLHIPLTDPYPHMSADTTLSLHRVVVGFDTSVASEPADLIDAGGIAGPPGDDQSYARFEPISDGAGFLARSRLEGAVDVSVGATDVLAVSVWVHPEPDPDAFDWEGGFFRLSDGSGLIFRLAEFTTGLEFEFNGTILQASRRLEKSTWRLITARANAGTGLMELWVGTDLVASTTPAALGAFALTSIQLGAQYVGGMGHVQVRVGPAASTMTHADHLAQHRHGYRGLQRQTVAERLVTLAGYAGLPATELAVSSAASTPLQVARLAGVSPADAFRAAARAGQDTLITSGTGKITVVPRSQRYNQPVTLEIPFGWIGYRGLKYRPDAPVTDVQVTRTGGGVARRIDVAKRSRYGVRGLSVDLDSAIDADPANLATWFLRALSQMRTRCPSIVIRMLRRTAAERKQLLALTVGQRIQITDLPDGSPEDVPHLIIQGIRHTIGPGRRRLIQFNTSPLLGPEPGVPPPCPVVGDLVDTDAIIAY
jgi:hypothetical protein